MSLWGCVYVVWDLVVEPGGLTCCEGVLLTWVIRWNAVWSSRELECILFLVILEGWDIEDVDLWWLNDTRLPSGCWLGELSISNWALRTSCRLGAYFNISGSLEDLIEIFILTLGCRSRIDQAQVIRSFVGGTDIWHGDVSLAPTTWKFDFGWFSKVETDYTAYWSVLPFPRPSKLNRHNFACLWLEETLVRNRFLK